MYHQILTFDWTLQFSTTVNLEMHNLNYCCYLNLKTIIITENVIARKTSNKYEEECQELDKSIAYVTPCCRRGIKQCSF